MLTEKEHQEWKKDLTELHELRRQIKSAQSGILQAKNKVAALEKKGKAQKAYIEELESQL